MNILFICSANKERSKTAHDYFKDIYPEHAFFSAGTNHKICKKEGTTPLTEDLLIHADLVYVMEEKHKHIVEKHTGNQYLNKITVLNIPDVYSYFHPELVDVLKNHKAIHIT